MIKELKDKLIILKKYTTLIESNLNTHSAPSIISKRSELIHDQIDPTTAERDDTLDQEEKSTSLEESGLSVSKNDDKTGKCGRFTGDNKKRNPKTHRKNENITMRKDPLIKGTNVNSSTFTGAPKRAWVYVGRVSESVQEVQVRDHLEEKFPGKNFAVEKLPSRIGARSVAFRISADMSLLEDLYRPENWPLDVVVKRYRFFRERNDAN